MAEAVRSTFHSAARPLHVVNVRRFSEVLMSGVMHLGNSWTRSDEYRRVEITYAC